MTASPSGCCLHRVTAVFSPGTLPSWVPPLLRSPCEPWPGPFQMIVGRRCGTSLKWSWQRRAVAWPADVANLCHGVCVGEDLWDAYDKMGRSFQQHAADSAANAHYDRPAVLAALGPVTGRRVLDAACGPGLYLGELLKRGAEVTAFDASPVMVSLARQQAAGRVRIDQAALGEPL